MKVTVQANGNTLTSRDHGSRLEYHLNVEKIVKSNIATILSFAI